jgi:hypothetical protein
MWLQNTAKTHIIITSMNRRKFKKLLHIQNQGIVHIPPSLITGFVTDDYRVPWLFNPDVDPVFW